MYSYTLPLVTYLAPGTQNTRTSRCSYVPASSALGTPPMYSTPLSSPGSRARSAAAVCGKKPRWPKISNRAPESSGAERAFSQASNSVSSGIGSVTVPT